MNQLETIFNELGITQYLGVFIDQGFDTWDTILDITESDLDALGVKLGHRRKLQRRIANYRSLTPVASLTSPSRASIEDVSANTNKNTQSSDSKDVAAPTKRRYRRHPRPDGNAPERPPSAYVLFSNKMRDDLKGQNLSFTEIAKLVGENWQSLNRSEKELFERQAQDAKDKYNRRMGEYKKTDDYRKYSDYLQEFRKRQAVQDKDSSKRLKADNETIHRGSSSSGGSMGLSGTTSGTGSGSDSQHGSEPPPTRQQRMTSVPVQEPRISPVVPPNTFRPFTEVASRSPRSQSHDETVSPRPRGLSSPHDRDQSTQRTRRHSGLYPGQIIPETSTFGLPSLTSPAPLPISHSPEGDMPSVAPGLPHAGSTSSGSVSSRFWSGPPSLRTQTSSSGSVSSYSPLPSRTPSDGSLPIHALLSSKPEMPPSVLSTPTQDILTPLKPPISSYTPNARPPGQPLSPDSRPLPYTGGFMMTSSAPFVPSSITTLPSRAIALEPSIPATPTQTSGPAEPGLDGMSALLRASDIVGRQKF